MGKNKRGGSNRDCYRFARNVQPGEAGELVHHVIGDGTIERAVLRMYIGARLDLRIKPVIRRAHAGGSAENIIKYVPGGKQYIDGDDDHYTWVLGIPVFTDDDIVVEFENRDANFDYDFSFEVEIDYLGGAYRVPQYGVIGGR